MYGVWGIVSEIMVLCCWFVFAHWAQPAPRHQKARPGHVRTPKFIRLNITPGHPSEENNLGAVRPWRIRLGEYIVVLSIVVFLHQEVFVILINALDFGGAEVARINAANGA